MPLTIPVEEITEIFNREKEKAIEKYPDSDTLRRVSLVINYDKKSPYLAQTYPRVSQPYIVVYIKSINALKGDTGKKDIEAIINHELAHTVNYDMYISDIMQGINKRYMAHGSRFKQVAKSLH